ncbi:hypothetical protein, partial [Candidatus Erwinia dacicola]|uniref:hypothetical protein n=1 Tax=Candidatus Erwinia dacicola TaxID=252393 RepID=UPI001C9D4D2F
SHHPSKFTPRPKTLPRKIANSSLSLSVATPSFPAFRAGGIPDSCHPLVLLIVCSLFLKSIKHGIIYSIFYDDVPTL